MKKLFFYAIPATLLSASSGFAALPMVDNFTSAPSPQNKLQLTANEMGGAQADAEENAFKSKGQGYFPGTDSELSAEEDVEISEPEAGAEIEAEDMPFNSKEPGYFPGTDSELSAEEDVEISEPEAGAEIEAEELPFNSKEPGYFPGTDDGDSLEAGNPEDL